MGLFSRNFDRPGPGVNKDEPRKKGVARFFEVLFRDFFDLVKLNVIFCFCILPAVSVFVLGLFGFIAPIMYVISLIAAFPVGGALTAYSFCITKLLRDDPGFIWHEFKRKFRENFKQAAAPGIVCAAIIEVQTLLWVPLLAGESGAGFEWVAVMLVVFLIFSMVLPYVFIFFAYLDLKALQTVKNGILLSLAYAPRSIAGAFSGGLIWIAFILFLPVSLLFLPLIAIIGFSLSLLLSFMWVWPPIDKQFSIEETINARREKE